MCVAPGRAQSRLFRRDCPETRHEFNVEENFWGAGIIWSDTQERAMSRAQKPSHSRKQAPPGLREAQRSTDTCDDDLGDIQNGAE